MTTCAKRSVAVMLAAGLCLNAFGQKSARTQWLAPERQSLRVAIMASA
jgi:hypothetical protein